MRGDNPEDRRQAELRAAGHAAYFDHDWDAGVLDLVFDSVVDSVVETPDERSGGVRRLRFTGAGHEIDAEVRGGGQLTVDVRIVPAGPVVVEAHTTGGQGPTTIVWCQGRARIWLRPQLTSFLLRWPGTDRQPIRTAWVLL
jgi:hypothetical protein